MLLRLYYVERRGTHTTHITCKTEWRPRVIWRKICGRGGRWKLDLMVNRSTSVGLCCLTITLLTLAKVQHDTFLTKIFDAGGGEKNWGGLQSQWGLVSENSWEWSEVGWELSSLGRPLPSLSLPARSLMKLRWRLHQSTLPGVAHFTLINRIEHWRPLYPHLNT